MEKGGRAPSDEVAKAPSEAGDVPSSLALSIAPGADHSDEVANNPRYAIMAFILRPGDGKRTCKCCGERFVPYEHQYWSPYCDRDRKAIVRIANHPSLQNCRQWWCGDQHTMLSAVKLCYEIRDENNSKADVDIAGLVLDSLRKSTADVHGL